MNLKIFTMATSKIKQRKTGSNSRNSINLGFIQFMESIIEDINNAGRVITAETYLSSLNSFRKFLNMIS